MKFGRAPTTRIHFLALEFIWFLKTFWNEGNLPVFYPERQNMILCQSCLISPPEFGFDRIYRIIRSFLSFLMKLRKGLPWEEVSPVAKYTLIVYAMIDSY
jgi:hypothetical protein